MSLPLDRTPPAELLERGESILKVLSSIPGGQSLAASFEPAQRTLRDAAAAKQRAAAEVADALLGRDRADERLDAAVTDLSLAALELADDDIRDSLFAKLFPEGPQAITCAAIEEEIRLVKQLLAKLDGHPLGSQFKPRIAIELEKIEEADRKLSAALEFESKAYAAWRRSEVAWLLQGRIAENALSRAERQAGRQSDRPSLPPPPPPTKKKKAVPLLEQKASAKPKAFVKPQLKPKLKPKAKAKAKRKAKAVPKTIARLSLKPTSTRKKKPNSNQKSTPASSKRNANAKRTAMRPSAPHRKIWKKK